MTGRANGRSGPGGLGPPGLTLGLVLLALALYLGAGPAPSAWVFDRAAIAQGDGWRLVTGHLAHSGVEHLFWNLTALLLIGGMLERRDRALLAWGLVAGAAAVDAWLWIAVPGLQRYCGLSGVLNTLMLLLLWQLWRETRGPWVILAAVLSAGKLVAELVSGQALLTHTAWPSVPAVHLAGLCAGVVVLLCRQLPSRSPRDSHRGCEAAGAPALRHPQLCNSRPGVLKTAARSPTILGAARTFAGDLIAAPGASREPRVTSHPLR